MILHWRIRTGSDCWFSKILWSRTGSDSILLDQDWIWIEKFHSPLISGSQCLETPAGLSLLLMLSFYRTNIDAIDQVKSNLS